jgi:hypothetical protein
MRKIKVNQALNELIDERMIEQTRSDKSVMAKIKEGIDEDFALDISGIRVMSGLNILAESLIKEVMEKTIFSQCDVMAEQRVDPDMQPELYAEGVRNVSFFARLSVADSLPQFNETMGYQIRYIFNAIQNDEIHEHLFPSRGRANQGILFPFHREDKHDETGFFYLLENVSAGRFLRITLESATNPRLRLSRIPHKIINHIDLIHARVDIPTTASRIAQGIMEACLSQKCVYSALNVHFGDYIKFLCKAGMTDLEVLSFSWPVELLKKAPTMGMSVLKTHIVRILYVLGDSNLIIRLCSGLSIWLEDKGFSCYLDLSQCNRCLNLALLEPRVKSGLPECLARMPAVMETVSKHPSAFQNTRVLLIHHLTSEVLGFIQAITEMGALSIDTLWVKYAGAVEPAYKEIMFSLPDNIFRFHGLTPVLEDNGLQHKFLLSDEYSDMRELEPLNSLLKAGSFHFYEAMRVLAGHLLLKIAKACRRNGEKLMIIEDGGYIAPSMNRLCLEKRTAWEAFEFFDFPYETIADNDLNRSFEDWLAPVLTGSAEHTRNGYDALKSVQSDFGKLAFPAATIAISRFKVNCESREVVYSCLNAVENIMNHMGFALSERTCLVLGAQGAIGRKSMDILAQRVGPDNLFGVDTVQPEIAPDWTYAPELSLLPERVLEDTDMILGVIGGSICTPEWIEQLIQTTRKKHLFFASGSTKTVEFSHLMGWLLKSLESPRTFSSAELLSIDLQEIQDPKTGTHQGRSVRLCMGHKTVYLHLLADLMPVNFLYYGVPSETMNQVMTELLEMSALIVRRHTHGPALPTALLALDHEIQNTE